jgi:hypothetical protein
MACGVPVLASNVGGNAMLAASGGAWLFEPGSVAALSETLAGVLADRAEMDTRGQRAGRLGAGPVQLDGHGAATRGHHPIGDGGGPMIAYAQQASALPRVVAGELPPPALEYAFFGISSTRTWAT